MKYMETCLSLSKSVLSAPEIIFELAPPEPATHYLNKIIILHPPLKDSEGDSWRFSLTPTKYTYIVDMVFANFDLSDWKGVNYGFLVTK